MAEEVIIIETGETIDYSKFQTYYKNRLINRKHVNELKDSITKKGYLPFEYVLVNQHWEIADGQHRFIACREMGLPIHYQMVKDAEKYIQLLNTTQKSWSMDDHIRMYSACANQNYVRFERATKRTGLKSSTALSIVNNSLAGGCQINAVKLGSLKFTAEDELKVTRFCDLAQKVCGLARIKPSGKCYLALQNLERNPKFRWETLAEKAEKYPTKAYPCRTKDEYIDMFNELYNYQTRVETKKL